MKRMLLVILGVLAVSTSAWAQGGRGPAPAQPLEPGASQAEVDKAVLAGPAQVRNAAMVIKWNPANWTYTTLRKAAGTSRIVCFDRSGLPGQQAFSVECTSVANLDRVAQNLKFEAEPDAAKRTAALAAAEKDGTRVKPEFGSVWWRLQGAEQATARQHTTVAVPGATAQSMGLPDTPTAGGVWIMSAGNSTAHLMIPGQ